MIRRILDRLVPARRRARAEELRARAEHRAKWCLARHPEYPWVECSRYVGDHPGRRHPGAHSGDWFEWPQDPYSTVSPECARGDCGPGRCPSPVTCGCGHHAIKRRIVQVPPTEATGV